MTVSAFQQITKKPVESFVEKAVREMGHEMRAVSDKEMDVITGCGTKQTIRVDAFNYGSWKGGTLIQNAFPSLSSDEREALITGLCKDCFGGIVMLGEECFV